MHILKERCEKIIKAGANVVITTKGIDDIASKYFVEANVFALRRVDKNDLRRIAKSTEQQLLPLLQILTKKEKKLLMLLYWELLRKCMKKL